MRAIDDFTQAIHLSPEFVAAYRERAEAYMACKDLQRAIEDYQRYLDLGGGQQNPDQTQVEKAITELRQQLK
jgi:regulator of sirC expression with transglutaminase-like and TPR domain